ncbi:SMP-30/gluconolactonase/LRE family protein [Frankia sp. AgB1.9]|uniref:SMP-30/gluconolactonase/LRE family protein n=1 Tax=unclassified Frankia TaxID=2632575 RepID=UPI0019342B83|nr:MULTISPECIES: SMP-30/gluconolactonase/LRE family protein [unclassified Frankia]MBL7487745.1 SMP-30/gluconolactonase/LRE family protein [Frankia sp. AgW1.1]MBL7548012.1 SMP-30/gluconolactonase/LRE family protein [Frankia sp. AgB1.9]MBL7622737.1 SMP-30/gluconolactonase/LRE family protein [Frankia sp. AgB1.8]
MTVLDPDVQPALLADGFVFAEGPRWRDGRLWFSDMHGEAVYTVTLAGETSRVLNLPGRKPSGLGFLPDGSALVVSMADRELLRLAPDGSYAVHARLGHLLDDELNDMVVAADGTAFVGSYSLTPDTGVLLRVTPDGVPSVAAAAMSFPNGAVISADGRTLTVAESKGRRFTAFDLDSDLSLRGRRVVATTPDAAPDGIALDADGGIWAGFPLAHEFRRVLPGGEVTDRIPTGERMAIACALGGPDGRTLFLLSARDWNSAALGGARTSVIETTRVRVPGDGLA